MDRYIVLILICLFFDATAQDYEVEKLINQVAIDVVPKSFRFFFLNNKSNVNQYECSDYEFPFLTTNIDNIGRDVPLELFKNIQTESID